MIVVIDVEIDPRGAEPFSRFGNAWGRMACILLHHDVRDVPAPFFAISPGREARRLRTHAEGQNPGSITEAHRE